MFGHHRQTFSRRLLGIVVILILGSLCECAPAKKCDESDVTEVFVSYDVSTDEFRINDAKDQYTVAYARFQNCVNSTGFGYLTISTVNAYTWTLNSSVQAYAAGLAEGHVTRELISLHRLNTVGQFCQKKTEKCQKLEKYLRANVDWVTKNAEQNWDDDYWYQVRLFYEQVRGLQDGYDGKPGRISMEVDDIFGLYLMQIQYELPDIEKVVWGPTSELPSPGHCSVLIKLLPSNKGGVKDVVTSHVAWTTYNNMLRILKLYDFYYRKTPTVSEPALGRSWAFSSYPGVLLSIDDFYILSSAMVTTETTNLVNNDGLFKKFVSPQSVPEGVRVVVANRLAEHGDDWSQIFSKYNSGTYNNQWMVVDYKQYDQYWQSILPGFLTVLEQIPGQTHYEDLTKVLLDTSYWASFNIPYFPEIYKLSNLSALVDQYGDFFSHDGAPRAKIFRRDQSSVVDIKSMMKLMRYNDFQHDPLARCNCTPPYSGMNGISARNDLNPPNGTYPIKYLGFELFGGIDMKLTSMELTAHGDMLGMLAINGPTFDPLPPFQWSTAFNPDNLSHWGHPDLWNFGPVWFNGTF